MLFSYSIGFVYLFFLVAVFTDIASAINYCSYYPKHTYGYAFIFSLTGYLGIQVNFFCQWKINYSVLQYSDCFESCPTIWSICGSYSNNIPESYQYCLVLYLLLQTLHLSLCLQRLVGGPRYLHQLVCQE